MVWLVDKDFSTPQPYFGFVTPCDYEIAPFGPCVNIPVNYKLPPPTARSESKIKNLKIVRDVFFVGGVLCCNQRFKDLVQSFEPDRHCFRSITLQDNDGTPLDGSYYHFTTQQDIDCIITNNASEWFRKRNPNDPDTNIKSNIRKFTEKRHPDIFLSKSQIEGKHLWTGGQLAWSYLFISDEFKAAWSKARMRGLYVHKKCKLLDQPWVAEEQMGPMLDDWHRYAASGRKISGNW